MDKLQLADALEKMANELENKANVEKQASVNPDKNYSEFVNGMAEALLPNS